MVIRIMELSKLLMDHPDIEDVYLSWEVDGTDEEPNSYWALTVTGTAGDGTRLTQVIDLCLLGMPASNDPGSFVEYVVNEFKTLREAA